MNKYTLNKNWFVNEYANHLHKNFSNELSKEFLLEFKKYTDDPLDSNYSESVLSMITQYAIENIDYNLQKIDDEIKNNGINRFVKLIDTPNTHPNSDPTYILANLILDNTVDKTIFNKVFSIKNVVGDLVEFNEIKGSFNINLINQIYGEESGYCENQEFMKEHINTRVIPNYAIVDDNGSKNLVKIYIYNEDFDENLFEELSYERKKEELEEKFSMDM